MLKAFFQPRPIKALLYLLLTLAILIITFLFFAIDNTPLVAIHQNLNRDDIQRAKQLLHVSPDARDEFKTISLNEKDINIAVSYLLNHFTENTTKIQIGEKRLLVQIAVFVPESPWGRFLDFSFKLLQDGEKLKIKSLKIGEISIPDRAANNLILAIVHSKALKKYWQVATHYVKHFQIGSGAVEISYMGSIADAAKQLVIQKHRAYPNLYLYQQQINEIVAQHDPAWRLSLTDLLQPLFQAAYRRSDETTAIQENRTVIIAVSSYVYKHELRRFLPLGLIYSKEYPVFAYKRIDIPQHFIASALLVVVGESLIGEQLGEDKELDDAAHGSGFSFIDLTADRAGTRFGQLAIASPQKARELQHLMSEIKDYTTIIPDALDLPEQMNEQTFQSRFGGVNSAAYKDMIYEIDKRITHLPLYQIH